MQALRCAEGPRLSAFALQTSADKPDFKILKTQALLADEGEPVVVAPVVRETAEMGLANRDGPPDDADELQAFEGALLKRDHGHGDRHPERLVKRRMTFADRERSPRTRRMELLALPPRERLRARRDAPRTEVDEKYRTYTLHLL